MTMQEETTALSNILEADAPTTSATTSATTSTTTSASSAASSSATLPEPSTLPTLQIPPPRRVHLSLRLESSANTSVDAQSLELDGSVLAHRADFCMALLSQTLRNFFLEAATASTTAPASLGSLSSSSSSAITPPSRTVSGLLWDGVNGENGDSAASDLSLLDALFGHAALDAAVGGTGHLGTGMRRGLTPDEREYCANEEEIAELNALLHQVHQEAVPLRLQILRSKFPNHFKLDLLERLMSTENASRGESSKQLLWIQTMLQLPYHVWSLPQPMPEATDDTQHFFLAKLHNARIALDTVCHGHVHIKNALLERYYAWLCRPTSFLKPLAVVGPPGMGKTTLLRLGCTRAMERPVELLAMGAATDGSYLLGHNYTYEGSQMGILARMLSKCQCMNPVLLFDELDKVSDTPRGEEIYNVLLQITDPQQNDVFMDRYIGSSLPLDLSKCLCLFTLNNIDRVPAALLDRMTVLHTKPLTTAEQKVVILEHLLPPYLDRYELHTVMSPTFATPEALVRLQQLALQHGFRTVDALLGRACLWAHAVKHNHEEVLRGEILGGAKDSSKTFWHRTPQGLLEITADHVQHLYDGMTLTSPMLPYIL